jgi:uracil-DNA glycosylase
MNTLDSLTNEIRKCDLCAAHLPLGPRPALRISSTARILIIGQAPGTRVHETGIPWNDPSGKRLREWMNVDDATFYDTSRIAIMPMGFCYPGKGKSGDLPPRAECAETWHERLLAFMPNIEFTLLLSHYALAHYLGIDRKATVTETVRNWQSYIPNHLPMPHPSPRNNLWLRKNPWFETEVVPFLQQRVKHLLANKQT